MNPNNRPEEKNFSGPDQKSMILGLGPGVHQIQMTAQFAGALLVGNESNRRVSDVAVRRYANDMMNDRWRTGNDLIVITSEGRLRNGQHRCWAVLRAAELMGDETFSIPVIIRIQEPGDEDEFDIFDAGKPRSPGDVLSIHGVPNANVFAAASRLILLYGKVPQTVWTGQAQAEVTRPEVTDFTLKHLDELEAALRPTFPRCNRSVFTALGFLVARNSSEPERFDEFYRGVSTGAGLGANDARLALRNLIQTPPQNLRRWGGSQSSLGIHIKAWNKFLLEEPTKLMRFSRSELPMPEVL